MVKRWKCEVTELGERYTLILGRWHFSAARFEYVSWRFAVSICEASLYWRTWSFNLTRRRKQPRVDIYVPEPAIDGL